MCVEQCTSVAFLGPQNAIAGGLGFVPNPTAGAYSASPANPLAGLKGPNSKALSSKGR